jgi:predicted CXXCH cytochrome family protein
MRTPDSLAPDLPSQATLSVPSTTRTLAVERSGNSWTQTETEANVFQEVHGLDYVVGSGANGLSFLIKRGNYLFQAPLSFYTKPGKWDLSPGYGGADLGFARPVAAECLLCHSGRPQPIAKRVGQYAEPPFEELAIGCESCHGPGSSHVANPKSSGSIVNPQKLAPRLAEDICMNCHEGGTARVYQSSREPGDFRPGQQLFATVAILGVPQRIQKTEDADLLQHHSAMKLSGCFRASAGKLSCLTCHDPHVQPRKQEVSTYFRARCFTCHTDSSCRLPLSKRVALAGSDDCVSCHMPKRQIEQISHSQLTNHRIPRSSDSPALVADIGQELDDLLIVDGPGASRATLDPVTQLRAYGQLADKSQVYRQRYLALLDQLEQEKQRTPYVEAALGHRDLVGGNSERALPHLTAGLALEETAVYQDLAEALVNLGRSDEAIPYLQTALDRDQYNATLRKTLILQYVNAHRYGEAQQQMKTYVDLFPGDSFMRGLLSRVSR